MSESNITNKIIIDNTEVWENTLKPELISVFDKLVKSKIPFVFSCNYVIGTDECGSATIACVNGHAGDSLWNMLDASGAKYDEVSE